MSSFLAHNTVEISADRTPDFEAARDAVRQADEARLQNMLSDSIYLGGNWEEPPDSFEAARAGLLKVVDELETAWHDEHDFIARLDLCSTVALSAQEYTGGETSEQMAIMWNFIYSGLAEIAGFSVPLPRSLDPSKTSKVLTIAIDDDARALFNQAVAMIREFLVPWFETIDATTKRQDLALRQLGQALDSGRFMRPTLDELGEAYAYDHRQDEAEALVICRVDLIDPPSSEPDRHEVLDAEFAVMFETEGVVFRCERDAIGAHHALRMQPGSAVAMLGRIATWGSIDGYEVELEGAVDKDVIDGLCALARTHDLTLKI